jgi:hypothetical protein
MVDIYDCYSLLRDIKRYEPKRRARRSDKMNCFLRLNKRREKRISEYVK